MAVGDAGSVIIADVGDDRRAPASDGVHIVRVRVADVDDAFARAEGPTDPLANL